MADAVSDNEFQEKVLDSENLVLVDFWAEWCGPCKMLGPIIEEIGEDMGDKVTVLKLDVDENTQTAQKFQVMSIPTVKLFKNGEVVENFVGVQPKANYIDAIEKHQ